MTDHEKFEPLANLQTSRVFFQLLNGVNTATNIANQLNITPQAVFEHLSRLIKIEIVIQGKRIGKSQEYNINKEKFSKLFIEKASRTLTRKIMLSRSNLKENTAFQRLIEEYIKEISKMPINITLLQAMTSFEEGLIRVFPHCNQSIFNQTEKSKQELMEILKQWRNNAAEELTPAQASLKRAFESTAILT